MKKVNQQKENCDFESVFSWIYYLFDPLFKKLLENQRIWEKWTLNVNRNDILFPKMNQTEIISNWVSPTAVSVNFGTDSVLFSTTFVEFCQSRNFPLILRLPFSGFIL